MTATSPSAWNSAPPGMRTAASTCGTRPSRISSRSATIPGSARTRRSRITRTATGTRSRWSSPAPRPAAPATASCSKPPSRSPTRAPSPCNPRSTWSNTGTSGSRGRSKLRRSSATSPMPTRATSGRCSTSIRRRRRRTCPWSSGFTAAAGRRATRSSVQIKPQAFMDKGFVFVSTNYRLLPNVDMATIVRDVAKSIRWVHDHIAEYGGDPKRLLVMGHSAGAQLAALVCTDDRYLKAEGLSLAIIKGCVPVDGDTYDVPAIIETAETRRRVHGLPQAKFGHREKFGNDPAKHRDFSAVTHVAKDKGIPPFLILHVADHPDTTAQAQRLGDVLKDAGVPVTVFGAQETTHNKINADLGLPDDPGHEGVVRVRRRGAEEVIRRSTRVVTSSPPRSRADDPESAQVRPQPLDVRLPTGEPDVAVRPHQVESRPARARRGGRPVSTATRAAAARRPPRTRGARRGPCRRRGPASRATRAGRSCRPPRPTAAGRRRGPRPPTRRSAGSPGTRSGSGRRAGTAPGGRPRTAARAAGRTGAKTDRTSRENSAPADDGLEHPVGRPHQRPGERDPLGLVGVEQDGAARPPRTAASFHARFTASPIPVFIPWPPAGLWTCPASPARKTRPSRKWSATRWWTRYCREPVHPRHPRPGHLLDLPAEVVERAGRRGPGGPRARRR